MYVYLVLYFSCQDVGPVNATGTRTKRRVHKASILKAMNMIHYRPTSVLSIGKLYIVTCPSSG